MGASRHASKQSDLVQKQLTGTLAVLLKRGWANETAQERHAFFAEVEHAVAGANDAAARRTGIEVFEVPSAESCAGFTAVSKKHMLHSTHELWCMQAPCCAVLHCFTYSMLMVD